MSELPLINAIPRFKGNEDRVNKLVNGTALETWQTSEGVTLPTFAKFLADKDEEISEASDAAEAAAASAASAAASAAIVATYATRAAASAVNLSAYTEVRINRWSATSHYAPAAYKKVAVEPTHTAKFQSLDGAWWELNDTIVDLRSFGAMQDNIADDSAALILATSFSNRLIIVSNLGSAIKVAGTIPVYGQILGIGNPNFALTVAGGVDRGFDLQSNSVLDGITITRGPTGSSASGEYNNAFVVGRYVNQLGTETRNVTVRNVNLIGIDAGVGRRSITGIYGNVCDSTFENITITGWVSYGIMCHWGGNHEEADPNASTVIASWHPRRLTFRNIRMHSPQPDAALGVLYLSATHDILVDGLSSDGVRNPITIAPGDVGGVVAQGESVGRILQNILVRNVDINNYEGTGFVISGASGLRAGARWLGINEKMSIRLENITIKRGALSTSGRMIDARLVTNLTIDGYNLSHGSGADSAIYTPALFIQACNNVKAKGRSHVPMAWEAVGSTNVEIDSQDVCLRTDYQTSAVGGRITAEAGAHSLGAALAVNDTTITLTALNFDIVAGSPIAVGGGYVVASAAAIEQATSIVIPIYPSPVSAASASAATVRKACKRYNLLGSTEGFYYGLHIVNTNSGYTEDVRVSRHFYRNGLHDIYARGTRHLKVDKSTFEACNQIDSASGNNIRFIDTAVGTVVTDCTFEDNLSGTTKCFHNIYLFGNSEGSIVKGNKFHRALTSAINYFLPTGVEMWADLGNNYFASTLAARITGTAIVRGSNVGMRVIGFATAIPTSGTWTKGDILFNEGAAASAGLGWICVTSGAPGTWKSIGTIAA
ncbi:hypothetical protein [Rhizobium phage RHph_X3_15]|nr:hypothetical protein [Rhizobium phage RHph_X3_15]